MLRDAADLDVETFAFAGHGERASGLVDVQDGAGGAFATIPDAHLLFNSDFIRSGHDLLLRGHDGGSALVRDYFASDDRATLMSRDGAKLSGDVVDAMTGSLAPNQYAQAGAPAPSAPDAVGRVVTATGDASIIRNGAAVTLKPGDPVLRSDVLQTQAGTMAVTFNDGSTLNLTANTRIVVSEFVYSPNGAGNSQLLNLVQGSLTFISGEVAHSGNMRIGTPVATMGIRGTVGGVTTASDGTVHFYVSQSATGAVIINEQGQIIANVVQDGPMIVVRPAGPLQVIAEEVQKSPAQLALELQALQQIVSIKAIGDQLLQQFFQQQNPNGPNPQSPQNGPHTQIPIDLNKSPATGNGDDPPPADNKPFDQATVHLPPANPDGPALPGTVIDLLHANLPPVTFAPLLASVKEDETLTFIGAKTVSLFDADTAVLTVTLTVTHGLLSLATVAGLTFAAGNGVNAATMTFSGTQEAINAALHGMSFTPDADYNGAASLAITTQDESSQPITTTVPIAVAPVNDAPVFATDTYGFTVKENAAYGTVVGAVHATDVDHDTLTYSISSGDDNHLFSVNSHGEIVVVGTLDYEGAAAHDLVVTATDPSGAVTHTAVHIGIENVAEATNATLTSTDGTSVAISQYGATSGFQFPGTGNVTTPGTPEDRIVLGFELDGHNYVVNESPLMNDVGMTPIASSSYTQDGINYFSTILNAGHGVTVTQTTGLGANANYFITNIDIYNGSGADLNNVRFMRNLDPDQDHDQHNTYDTYNDVLQNPSQAHALAAVQSIGPITGRAVAMIADGGNWRASAYGFTNTNPYATAAYDNPQDPNGARADIAIALTNNVGAIGNGFTAHLSFITTANVASTGDNALIGTAGADTINGLGGNDLLFGLDGADTFVFEAGYGKATVYDFSGHNGDGDKMAINCFNIAYFADLQQHATISDVGTGTDHATKIDLGNGDAITLLHVDPTQITAADFIFHPLLV